MLQLHITGHKYVIIYEITLISYTESLKWKQNDYIIDEFIFNYSFA